MIFLHGEKDNFKEHSQILAFAEWVIPILIVYLAGKC
jgi:hypothetical protein